MLKGEYMGCMECHIEGDFLLIWVDAETGIIEVLRLGSHSELLKNIDLNTEFVSVVLVANFATSTTTFKFSLLIGLSCCP